jgi:hypothetical protein
MRRGLKKWLSLLLGLAAVVGVVIVPASGVIAATTADVTVNATPTYISIALNTSTYDFSTVVAGTDEESPDGYFGVTNDSTVITSTTIVSNGWQDTNGVAPDSPWTWDSPGEDQGQMKASNGGGVFDVTIDDETPAALESSTSADTDWVFEIQIDAPSSFTHGQPQGTTLTLDCTAD